MYLMEVSPTQNTRDTSLTETPAPLTALILPTGEEVLAEELPTDVLTDVDMEEDEMSLSILHRERRQS